MSGSVKRIDARALKAALHDGLEITLLDAREELTFGKRHILMASCMPLGRIEVLADDMVPRRRTHVVWCDDGGGLGERAAQRMADLGYSDVSILDGGIAAWESAGFRIYSGVHVPSKAFAEVVEHDLGTPWITATELKTLIDAGQEIAVFDSRSFAEYHSNSIPTAVSVPGAELVYRFKDLVPSPSTMVIVNCGGRTRSIVGAQSLINAGVPNKVVSLKDGTMAWHLAGFQVAQGADRRPREVSPASAEAARRSVERVASGLDIPRIDPATFAAWRAESDRRSLYVLDVRTPEEYEADHVAGIRSAPGGQLVQETDNYLATWGARVVLADTDGVRAVMTASWLKQMGWSDVAVIETRGCARKPSDRSSSSSRARPRACAGCGNQPGRVEAAARSGHSYANRSRIFETLPKRPYPWDLVRNAHAAWRSPRETAPGGKHRAHIARRRPRTYRGGGARSNCREARPCARRRNACLERGWLFLGEGRGSNGRNAGRCLATGPRAAAATARAPCAPTSPGKLTS